MTEPDWSELRITDSDIDAPEDESPAAPMEQSARSQSAGPIRPGLGLRWCAAFATAALLAAAGAIVFTEHRGRTVTTTRYQNAPAHTIDAGGCPNGDNCSPLDGLSGSLAAAIEADFPATTTLFANELIDTSASDISRSVRIVQLTSSHVRVTVLTQCRSDGRTATSRTQDLDGQGPTLAAVVRPYAAGCSVAVLAAVPAGQRVPTAELMALATDPQARQP